MMKLRTTGKLLFLGLLLAGCTLHLAAQNNQAKIKAQKDKIKKIEQQIANEQKKINSLQKDKASTEAHILAMSRQIENRNDLLQANLRQAELLQVAIDSTNLKAEALSEQLTGSKARFAEMVRESYRNFRNENYKSYIFAANGFSDMARRIAVVREIAVRRTERIDEIKGLSAEVAQQQAILAGQKAALDSVKRKINSEKANLERDKKAANNKVKTLNAQQKKALNEKAKQERQLTLAREELLRLSKGNNVGTGINSKSKIDIPVKGGRVGTINGAVCEIFGQPSASVSSIYDGKVIAIKPRGNRYDIYIAHGEESVSSYSNLSAVSVKVNQNVKKQQQIGTIGAWVNPSKSELEYKILFQLHSANGKQSYNLRTMFGKK